MRKIAVVVAVALLTLLLFGTLIAGIRMQGGPSGPGIKPADSTSHYQQLSFVIKPGGSESLALPPEAVRTGCAVRIDVSFSLHNAGTQKPSEIMCAVVNRDPESHQITWIGTNNDGTSKGSSSTDGRAIAHIYGGASPTVNASLEVGDAAAGTLMLTQNASTTARPGYYCVTIWH